MTDLSVMLNFINYAFVLFSVLPHPYVSQTFLFAHNEKFTCCSIWLLAWDSSCFI